MNILKRYQQKKDEHIVILPTSKEELKILVISELDKVPEFDLNIDFRRNYSPKEDISSYDIIIVDDSKHLDSIVSGCIKPTLIVTYKIGDASKPDDDVRLFLGDKIDLSFIFSGLLIRSESFNGISYRVLEKSNDRRIDDLSSIIEVSANLYNQCRHNFGYSPVPNIHFREYADFDSDYQAVYDMELKRTIEELQPVILFDELCYEVSEYLSNSRFTSITENFGDMEIVFDGNRTIINNLYNGKIICSIILDNNRNGRILNISTCSKKGKLKTSVLRRIKNELYGDSDLPDELSDDEKKYFIITAKKAIGYIRVLNERFTTDSISAQYTYRKSDIN